MSQQLALTPAGSLVIIPGEAPPTTDETLKAIQSLFAEDKTAQAFFALAAEPAHWQLPPDFDFWREFACAYLKVRCQTSIEGIDAKLLHAPALDNASAQRMIDSAPPMAGAEYLSPDLLQEKWSSLDEWLMAAVTEQEGGLSAFLATHAPRWHISGQVYFHLAENKNDPELPFAFMATWLPNAGQGAGRHQPLAKALSLYAGRGARKKLEQLLQPIDLAARSSKLIKTMVEQKLIYRPQAWHAAQAYQFLQQVPSLQDSGVKVRLPDWWEKRPKPQVQATLSTPSSKTLHANQLLQFSVNAVLDGETLTPEQWQQLMNADSGLMLLKGRWVEVDREQLSQAMQQMKALEKSANTEGLTFFEGMRLLAGSHHQLGDAQSAPEAQAWRFVQADKQLSKLIKKIRHPESLRSALPGKSLNADLRPYQRIGVRWLWQLSQLGLGACLADDMGLGKTIQIISLLLLLKKNQVTQPSLLVLPTSLLGNWKSELEKFAPSLNCCFIHSSINHKERLATWARQGLPENTDLALTSYGTLSRQTWLRQQHWHTVVLDEAQAIKNAGTRQAKAAKGLQSVHRIALTGTPVENRLSDLWPVFDFINPGLLGSFNEFKRFAKTLEQNEGRHYAPLRKLVQPYILRRLKTDKTVISDLPDKTEVHAWCGLSTSQAILYQQSVNELAQALDTPDGMKRRGLILAFILRFKQICNHPAQLLSHGTYSPEESGKFVRLAEIAEQISARQEKLLVFTQFRELCEPLANALNLHFGREGLVLHGGTSAKQRQARVEAFQRDSGPPFMVLSLKAGGTGLNLTAASHVIHFDRWWNPAVENQATDRAFRIGQKRNVMVHKFVCRGTIEEKIDTIINDKSALADDVLAGDAGPLVTEMNNDELLALVRLDLHQVQN
jgi:non-specific serine/threonine protein kinase